MTRAAPWAQRLCAVDATPSGVALARPAIGTVIAAHRARVVEAAPTATLSRDSSRGRGSCERHGARAAGGGEVAGGVRTHLASAVFCGALSSPSGRVERDGAIVSFEVEVAHAVHPIHVVGVAAAAA